MNGIAEPAPVFVLVHSPSVGPATWEPVAGQLREAGHSVVVPSLLGVADGGPPYWPRVVAAVRAGLGDADPSRPVTLVAHSNAGLFVPVLISDVGRTVTCALFADASVPPAEDSTPAAEPEFLPFLRDMVSDDGRLSRWTDWWPDEDITQLLPDPRLREVIVAEQPRLPLDYYLDQIPLPSGWDDRPSGYLLFSDGYQSQAELARQRDWPVRTVAGQHLHQVVDPGAVARALLELATGWRG